MQTKQNTNNIFERLFHLSENNTSVKRESIAGLTTFVSMAYILFVNANILGASGMNPGAIFTATAISAVIGCILMGVLANFPIAIAPALGDNAFFTYSVVLGMGIPWQQALAGVFVASVLFTFVSFFKIREIIINAIPQDLKYAMAAGIGIFVAFVGLQGGGIIVDSKSSLVEIGQFSQPTTMLTLFGIVITGFLMAKKVPGSLFFGMVATALLGLGTGVIKAPHAIISAAPSLKPTFGVALTNLHALADIRMWAVVIVFFIVAFFDTAGTLVGLAQQAGIMKDGKIPHVGRALVADSVSMLSGSLMGTTPTAAYIESSAGIAVGGKTGLTAVVTGILFAASMLFSPLLAVVTTNVTAPALIVVGVLMASALREIQWEHFEIAFPSFLILIGIPLTYNITYGIAFGFLAYPLFMTAAGRRKEVSWLMWLLFFVFILLLYILNVLPHE